MFDFLENLNAFDPYLYLKINAVKMYRDFSPDEVNCLMSDSFGPCYNYKNFDDYDDAIFAAVYCIAADAVEFIDYSYNETIQPLIDQKTITVDELIIAKKNIFDQAFSDRAVFDLYTLRNFIDYYMCEKSYGSPLRVLLGSYILDLFYYILDYAWHIRLDDDLKNLYSRHLIY